MNKHTRALSALLLALVALAGCAGQSDQNSEEDGGLREVTQSAAYSPSNGIDLNGYWEGITALDHVELYDYQTMTIPSETHSIPDETVQSEINNILASFSNNQQVLDRAVENGDTVNIDYVGSVDGVEFEGGNTEGMGTDVTIGVTNYIDDFLEQLIGHSPGETINVEVTFPEEYGVEELNGKDAVFVTEINYIVETVASELNDAFVAENFADYYGWSTVEELNQGIAGELRKAAVQSYTQDYLMENVSVLSLPAELLAYMEQSMISYYQDMADYYGMDAEELLAMNEGISSFDELVERYHDNNVEQANYFLIMQAVAEDAGITANDGDVAAYFADTVGDEDYSQYEVEYGMPYLKQITMHQLVLDYLIGQAVLE